MFNLSWNIFKYFDLYLFQLFKYVRYVQVFILTHTFFDAICGGTNPLKVDHTLDPLKQKTSMLMKKRVKSKSSLDCESCTPDYDHKVSALITPRTPLPPSPHSRHDILSVSSLRGLSLQ